MKNKTISNKIFSLFGLLLIGAIGSGLWDLFLKDLIYYLGGLFVQFLSFIHDGYIDSLYKNVGKDLPSLQVLPAIALIVIIIFIPIFIYIRILRFFRIKEPIKNFDTKDSYLRKIINKYLNTRKKIITFMFIMYFPMSLIYTDLLITETSNLKAINYVNRCSEIIRPKITNTQYIQFKSEFRQIDNRDKLNSLIKKLFKVANDNTLKLPECNLYGIKID